MTACAAFTPIMRPKSPQAKDVQNDILLAWVLTLPVCVLLGEPTFSTSSTGSSAITPKATRPLDARTPIKFHTIDYGDCTLMNFIGMKKS
jgi:hypothetical protein